MNRESITRASREIAALANADGKHNRKWQEAMAVKAGQIIEREVAAIIVDMVFERKEKPL